MLALAFTLLSALAAATPAPRSHRVSALLIPMDRAAEAQTLKLEGYMNQSLEEFATVQLLSSDELFGSPAPDDAARALQRAEQGRAQGRLAFQATHYAEAERKLAAAVREYKSSAAALQETRHFCEALATYGASQFQLSHPGAAKETLLDFTSLCPEVELGANEFTKEFLAFKREVTASRDGAMSGNAAVRSKPSGARILLDGQPVGFAPQTLFTLSPGKHLVRLERPGFHSYGAWIEINPEDVEVAADLRPTQAYRAYDAMMDKLAAEVDRDRPAKSLAALGKTLGLDRAIVGTVKQLDERGTLELIIGLYDVVNGGKKLSGRRAVLQGEEFGQLKFEVGRLINYLLTNAEAPPEHPVKTSDPLETRRGTEEWGGDDRGGETTRRTKKPLFRDPLDGVSGTEDW